MLLLVLYKVYNVYNTYIDRALLYRLSNIASPPFFILCSSLRVAVYIWVVAGFECLRVYCACSNEPPALRILTAAVCLRECAVNTRLSNPTACNPCFAIPDIVRVVRRSPVFLWLSEQNNGAPCSSLSVRVVK